MALTEARKRANRAWDAEHMDRLTVHLRKETLADFKAAAAARGDKVNSILREAIEAYINDKDREG